MELKRKVFVLPLIVLATLSAVGIMERPQIAQSQTDYEEYLIVETNTAQELAQKNVGSGESTNINCGTNIAGANLHQPIACPSIPGGTPSNGDEAPVFDTITVSETLVIPSGPGTAIQTVAVLCPEGTEVTGGGFDFNPKPENHEELPVFLKSAPNNNGWEIAFEGNRINSFPSEAVVYAECGRILIP